jgi:nitroreductase
MTNPKMILSVEDAIRVRYACTRFRRYGDGGGGDGDGGTARTANKNSSSSNSATASAAPITNDPSGDAATGASAAAARAASPAPMAGPSDPAVVRAAFECLDVARRAPSGFNIQPYRLLLVHSPRHRQALARYCIGRNADRVRDSDCTAIFLADRQCLRTLPQYRELVKLSPSSRRRRQQKQQRQQQRSTSPTLRRRLLPDLRLLKLQALVGLFSSGLPLPVFLSAPLSWAVGFAMRVVSWICRHRLVVPTLSGPETWSQKNTMLVAMTYLLACTSRGLATTPMEGYLTWGIRRELKIPRRYTIPLIVSTGRPYHDDRGDDGLENQRLDSAHGYGGAPSAEESREEMSNKNDHNAISGIRGTAAVDVGGGGAESDAAASAADEEAILPIDDAGMVHGNGRDTATPRFPTDSIIYGDVFGTAMKVDTS